MQVELAICHGSSWRPCLLSAHTPLLSAPADRTSPSLPFLFAPAPTPRLKASLERCLRLTEGYTDALLEVLPSRAAELGGALGLDDWAVRTFTEGEVRASVVFQLSKLAALLLVAARSLAGVTPWDTLVAGTAVGRLVQLQSLDPGALEGETSPVVLLLRSADGDEEVAAAGRCVRGIVLTQELPHLSHLGEPQAQHAAARGGPATRQHARCRERLAHSCLPTAACLPTCADGCGC